MTSDSVAVHGPIAAEISAPFKAARLDVMEKNLPAVGKN
jgi:hypothetical protein